MAISTHSTLASYDEDSTSKIRVRSLDDIRLKERETLHKSRQLTKVINMLRNRPTLAESLLSNTDDDYDASTSSFIFNEPFGQSDFNSSPDADQNSDYDYENWLAEPSTDLVDSAPKSHWSPSSSSRSTNNPLTIETNTVPPFFFETPETSRSGSPGGRTSRGTPPPSQRQQLYKTGRTLHTRTNFYCDHAAARKQFNEIKDSLLSSQGNADRVSSLIQVHWLVLLNALKSNNDSLVSEALLLLKSLASENLIQPNAVLHMLQHGLIFAAREFMAKSNNGFMYTIHLFLLIARTTPSSIPYMVDLMSSSDLFTDIEDRMVIGRVDELQVIMEFYYHITEATFSRLYVDTQNNQHQMLIPHILLITGVSEQTLQSYSPVSTLNKCISTNLIRNTANRILNRMLQKEDALISKALLVLANIMKLIHYRTATENCSETDSTWLARLLAVLRDAKIESKIEDLDKAFDRLIKVCDSSEHYSQGFGLGEGAARSKQQCLQFLSFYNQQYAYLAPIYESWMNNWEIGYQTPQRLDGWDMD